MAASTACQLAAWRLAHAGIATGRAPEDLLAKRLSCHQDRPQADLGADALDRRSCLDVPDIWHATAGERKAAVGSFRELLCRMSYSIGPERTFRRSLGPEVRKKQPWRFSVAVVPRSASIHGDKIELWGLDSRSQAKQEDDACR